MAIKLIGDGRRRAQQLRRVFDHIAARDVKVEGQQKPKTVAIFPTADSALQGHLTAIRARLQTLLTP